MRSRQSLSALATSIRRHLATLEHGAKQREMLAEVERYARAITRWESVTPTDAQCAAMLEQLVALDERAQRASTNGATNGAPAQARPPKPRKPAATTTKLERTATAKVPRPPKP